MLVQNWATLRFSDHWGLNPGEVTFREGSFHARLTRSKMIGQDKTITSKAHETLVPSSRHGKLPSRLPHASTRITLPELQKVGAPV